MIILCFHILPITIYETNWEMFQIEYNLEH